MSMRFEVGEEGEIEVRDLDPIELDTLRRIPELLQSDDPRVRDRLLPSAYDDPDEERQWRELVTPELEHLFANRSEVVAKDLRGVVAEDDLRGFRFTIPAGHRSAWESALTGSSHALYLLAELHPDDVAGDPGDIGEPERDLALLRIRILGYMLWEFLELDGYG